MTEIRNAEVANAQSSNSILSPLVGAQQQAPMQQPVVDTGGVVPQQGQQIAQDLSSDLYGSGFVEGGENQSGRLSQELFNYDQQLEKGYSPFPKKDFYVENPADLYKAGSSYAGGMGQVSGSVGKAVSGAELAYNNAVSAVLDKFTNFYKMKQDEEEARKDREERMDKEKREEQLSIVKMLGGKYTDSMGVEHVFDKPSTGTQGDRDRSRVFGNIESEVKSGVPIEDLIIRYADGADYSDLRRIYDSGSPYGPGKKGDEYYRSLYNEVLSNKVANDSQVDPEIIMTDFNDFRGRLEGSEEEKNSSAKQQLLEFTQKTDPDNYEGVKAYLDIKYPDPDVKSDESNWFQNMIKNLGQSNEDVLPSLSLEGPGQENVSVYNVLTKGK